MDYPIRLAGMEGQNFALRANSLSGPKLVLNGQPLPKQKGGLFQVRSNAGSNLGVKFKTRFLDPIPDLVVGGQTITIVPPLQWYQYAVMALPMILIFFGGAIGGLFGGVGSYMNSHVFRSNLSDGMKYSLAILVAIAALVSYLIVAAILVMVFKK